MFQDLFVLEMANNHLGSLARGLAIVNTYTKLSRFHNIRAAIKFQIRDVDNFIHHLHVDDNDRYIKKTRATRLSFKEYQELTDAIWRGRCLPMATPFDEASVDTCVRLDLPIIKIASSDANDWPLIERIAWTRRPTIVSTGGCSEKDLDDVVRYFENRDVPLAINHCVSLYPSEPEDCDLNQIDYLKGRYPGHTIGWSSHEYSDGTASLAIAYAKGARTFERHVDVHTVGTPMSDYCAAPGQVARWFESWHDTVRMCGRLGKRISPAAEIEYLDKLVRGAYAAHDLTSGTTLTADDVYFAIPMAPGQLSCRDLIPGEVLGTPIAAHAPIKRGDLR